MNDAEKLKQDILQLIESGCTSIALSQPIEYTAENMCAINNHLKRQVGQAIDRGSIVVDFSRHRIYLVERDEYLNMLPVIPMIYSDMLYNIYTVVGIGGKILGTVKYGGPVNETILTNSFGVYTEFTYAEPIKTIQTEVTIS